MAEWSLDLEEYADKKTKLVENIKNKFVFALYNSITFRTPVDTGRARGNWNISVNNADTSTNENQKTPQYTNYSQAPKTVEDQSAYISNGLDYIEGLEYGRSKQAPEGMVGVTLADADNILMSVVDGEIND